MDHQKFFLLALSVYLFFYVFLLRRKIRKLKDQLRLLQDIRIQDSSNHRGESY